MEITYFKSPAEFRRWLRRNGGAAQKLWVGFHKVSAGVPSMTWPESVDQALCFGWIDGVRKNVDAQRYCIRFTPRKAGSAWSAVNVRRVAVLREKELMQPAGKLAFAARKVNRTAVYSYEQRPAALPEPFMKRMAQRPAAVAFFDAQPPSYRRAAIWWVVSAKQETTQLRRLERLTDDSAHEQRIKQFVSTRPAGRGSPARRPSGSRRKRAPAAG